MRIVAAAVLAVLVAACGVETSGAEDPTKSYHRVLDDACRSTSKMLQDLNPDEFLTMEQTSNYDYLVVFYEDHCR